MQTRYQKDDYEIEENPRKRLSLPSESAPTLFVHCGSVTAWGWYLVVRAAGLVNAPNSQQLTDWLLLLCEGFLLSPELHQGLDLFISAMPASLCPGKRPTARPALRLVGTKAPMVHVFVTCCGEDLEVIMNTAIAAAAQDYPRSRFKVILLDDKNSPALRNAVEHFNVEQAASLGLQRLTHMARDKSVPGKRYYYKAGNLRYGIGATANDPDGSEFFAALDADMVPEKDWLSRTVPHLLLDNKLAMAGPAQLLYNVPEHDALSQDSGLFSQITEPMHDRFGAAQCSGSGYIMRRAAVDSIGGWPLANVGEDLVISHVLAMKGWDLAYIEDKLQFGLAPDSFAALVKQKIRWTQGDILLAGHLRRSAEHGISDERAFVRRWLSRMHAARGWLSLVGLLMLFFPWILAYNGPSPGVDRRALRLSFLLAWTLSRLSRQTIFSRIGSLNMLNWWRSRTWSLPYGVTCLIQSWFVSPDDLQFQVTGAQQSIVDERSASRRQCLRQRFSGPWMATHTAHWMWVTMPFLVCLWHIVGLRDAPTGRRDAYSHTGLMLRLLDMVQGALVPVVYMFWPPTVPEREELVQTDERGIQYAREKTWRRRDAHLQLLLTFFAEAALIWWLDFK